MQLLGSNPQMYGAELSRQLAAGAGPFNIQAAQVPHSLQPADICTCQCCGVRCPCMHCRDLPLRKQLTLRLSCADDGVGG